MSARRGLVALCAGALVPLALAPAAAQQAGSVQVVARGLENPRGLDIGPKGAVYVAEAGSAGKNCRNPSECYGFTAAITRITENGQRRVRHGLLSLGPRNGSQTVGSNDVVVTAGGKIFTIVSSAGPKPRRSLGARVARQSGNLLKLKRGRRKIVSQVDVFEFRRDPDGDGVDSNPYGIDFRKGTKVVADAGGNSLLRIGPNGGKKLITTFPDRKFGGERVDDVPTSVAISRSGVYYVGTLGGAATPQGRARVWRVAPNGKKKVFRGGFDMIVGVDLGPDGSLYVVELLRKGWPQFETGDFTGSLIRVEPNGDRTELARGRLNAPGGLAVARNGDVYVSVNSLSPRNGKVVRVSQ